MTEHPILFSGPMVTAIIAGQKSQTRRVLKHDGIPGVPPTEEWGPWEETHDPGLWIGCNAEGTTIFAKCPYGATGDRLVVCEQHRFWSTAASPTDPRTLVQYRADMAERWCDAATKPAHTADEDGAPARWRPSIFMPRWASRLTLEVTNVRIERLQAITDEDARAEGCLGGHDSIPSYLYSATPHEHYRWLWGSINGKRPGCRWEDNLWVWAVSFRRLP